MAKRNKKDGRVGSMYMILYGIGRFLIEFLRDDPRGEVGFLSTSQFISLFIVAAGVILYVLFGRRPDAEPAQVAEEASDEDEENEDEAEEESEGSEESGAEEESEGSEEAAKETEKADDPETKSEEEKSE